MKPGTGLQRWRPAAPAEPPVCAEKMRRWREREIRLQRAEAGGATNYWEMPERNPVERKSPKPMSPKWKRFWFRAGLVGIVALVVVSLATQWFHFGVISVFLFRQLLKLTD